MAAPTIHSLLPDLLEAILCYIPPRPRLLTVSTVCKRWRTLALRTIKKLPCRKISGVDVNYFPFTNLTQLDLHKLDFGNQSLRCPPSVKELKGVYRFPLSAIPPLASIKFFARGGLVPHSVDKLLNDSRQTLRSLDYRFDLPRITGHFPLLSALTIAGYPSSDLCRDHASQLTRLTIERPAKETPPFASSTPVFPHLTCLTVPADLLFADIALASFPALQTLTIRGVSTGEFLVLHSRVAHYELDIDVSRGTDLTQQFAKALASLPKLTGLSVSAIESHSIAGLKPTVTRLTLAKLSTGPCATSSLSHLTRLSRLTTDDLLLDAPLPSVSKLKLTKIRVTDSELSMLADCFPRLRALVLTIPYPSGRAARRSLIPMLRALDSTGICKIRLTLVLYAQGYKRKNLLTRLRGACKTAYLSVWVDDQSSETEESSATDSDEEVGGKKKEASNKGGTRTRRSSSGSEG